MRVLVIGSTGQVGGDVVSQLSARDDRTVIAPARDEFDLTESVALRSTLRELKPDAIVNAAAYTAVDAAETDRDTAFAVNATGPEVLAKAASKLDIPLIHYSTDYVFDGGTPEPRRPGDQTCPLNVYGASKLAGEHAIMASGCHAIIVRLCWVYSARGNNFVNTMLRLAESNDTLNVVNDQTGTPTPSHLIATWTLQMLDAIERGDASWGLFHASCNGSGTWFDFAHAIFEHASAHGVTAPEVCPVASSAFPTPASRPRFSVMDCAATDAAFGLQRPHWSECVGDVVAERIRSSS